MRILGLTILLLLVGELSARELQGDDLVSVLRQGGYVIVMRHASSPSEEPDAATAKADNPTRERQLDAAGRRNAAAMGESLRRLQIPISAVLSSPAYRTLETARLAGIGEVEIREYLGNQGMQRSSEVLATRLLQNIANPPRRGNRLLITHSPNIAAAFPDLSPSIEQGEALLFDADISTTVPVARILIEEWQSL